MLLKKIRITGLSKLRYLIIECFAVYAIVWLPILITLHAMAGNWATMISYYIILLVIYFFVSDVKHKINVAVQKQILFESVDEVKGQWGR